jgi:hypothetical protein
LLRISSRQIHLAAVTGLALLAAACQPQQGRVQLASDEKLQITRSVWEDFEAYKSKLGRGGGAFVVTESGLGSGYSLCPGDYCRPGSYTHNAIQLCEQAGVKCVVFARSATIVVDYEIVD